MAITDNTIRREIGYKFRLAIDCEETGNNHEAYKNYLDGLSLVASTLKIDSEMDSALMTITEKETLLGFAKQSVDRLLIILKKSDKLEIKKNLEEILEYDTSNSTTNLDALDINNEMKTRINNNWKIDVFEENTEPNVCSPLEELQKENNILVARYNKRMLLAASDFEKQNLQLELERRLAENSAIATQRQGVWIRQREKLSMKFKQLAEQKFSGHSEKTVGTLKDIDAVKQETFAASLQFAMDSTHLKNLLLAFSEDESNTTLSRSIITCILNDSKHPVSKLLCQMQSEVLKKVSCYLCEPSQGDNKDHLTHFRTVSNDIKGDINTLDSLLKALCEQLLLSVHLNIVTELIHYFYFKTLKNDLICFLRICTKEVEENLESEMNLNNNTYDIVLDEDTKNIAVLNLRKMISHHSPCGMLDWLVAICKCLAHKEDLASNFLGTDDLLPRLIEVVLSSREYSLPAHALFMESFLPSFKALGEEGYSLTLLQSVIICITKQT